ncbi:hypothetical protein FRACA_260045 [Frankia canadensis]|uniref:Uncharacterized protein n=1 Tax=Frankia canadensis TaxID=1836972 RepID=A0A2I2KSE1_9ACTN|nr:hypothetical protein FRACA_260045 [Frankia canadensis]SOU55883.1 hypothetical protein FRACA_260045 [Frankia canadensis]
MTSQVIDGADGIGESGHRQQRRRRAGSGATAAPRAHPGTGSTGVGKAAADLNLTS